jgi:hypothetical protein
LIALTPALTIFLLFIALVMATVGWRKEQEHQAAILMAFSPVDREAASEKLSVFRAPGRDLETVNSRSIGFVSPTWIPSVIITVLLTVSLLVPLVETTTAIARVSTMLHHYALFDALRSAASEAVGHTLMAILLSQTNDLVSFWNVSASRELATRGLTELVLLHKMLNTGYHDVTSALGFNDQLDVIRFSEKCTSRVEEGLPVCHSIASWRFFVTLPGDRS